MTSSAITVVAASCARLGFPLPSSCPTLVLAAPAHHTSMLLVPGNVAISLVPLFHTQARVTDSTAAGCLPHTPVLTTIWSMASDITPADTVQVPSSSMLLVLAHRQHTHKHM